MDRAAPASAAVGIAPACDAFGESLRSERAWRNVQPILLASFSSVAQLLTAQAQQIQGLHQQLTLLQTSMETRDARVETVVDDRIAQVVEPFRRRLMDTCAQEQREAVALVLERVQELYVTKEVADERAVSQRSSLAKLCNTLNQEIHQHVTNSKREMECEWRDALQRSTAGQSEVLSQQLREELQQGLERMKSAVVSEVTDEAQRQLHEELSKSASRTKTSHTAKIGHGPEHEMDEAVDGDLDRGVAHELQCIEAKLSKQVVAWREELTQRIDKKPCRSEITKLLSRKMDSLEAWKQFAEKADSARVEDISSKLVDMTQRAQETAAHLEKSKADAHDTARLKQNLHELLSIVELLQHEASGLRAAMSQKLSVEDAKQLIDSRTTLVGLEKTIGEMESVIAKDFITKTDLQSVVQQVHCIKQQLRSEIYQARYIWKDGRPSLKQTIAWNTQVVNTNADVFVWKAGSDKIMLKVPGLYHLQAAFFTDFTPTIQVLVNGEPGLVLAGEEDAIIARPAGSPKSSSSNSHFKRQSATAPNGFKRVHHSAGNVVGLAIDTFLALPARAVVQISYDIDEKAQGFLNLRKL